MNTVNRFILGKNEITFIPLLNELHLCKNWSRKLDIGKTIYIYIYGGNNLNHFCIITNTYHTLHAWPLPSFALSLTNPYSLTNKLSAHTLFLSPVDFLREDTLVGTSFLRVAAHDDDFGTNAAITYSMSLEQPEYLRVNPVTGWVYVNQPISQVSQQLLKASLSSSTHTHMRTHTNLYHMAACGFVSTELMNMPP